MHFLIDEVTCDSLQWNCVYGQNSGQDQHCRYIAEESPGSWCPLCLTPFFLFDEVKEGGEEKKKPDP